jgi:tetratricopeptide (TPR) repeat protein
MLLIVARQICQARVDLEQARFSETLIDCDSLDATGADVPMVNEYRATANNHLARYEAALDCCRKWEAGMGGDYVCYFEMGIALMHLDRPMEAAAEFAKSLDEEPDAAASFAELAKLLPERNKSEIAARFAKCQRPRTTFLVVAKALDKAHDLPALKALVDAYAADPRSNDDPALSDYREKLERTDIPPGKQSVSNDGSHVPN